ncbi:TPA: hypothetical protein U2Q76_000368 [Acinetobacter baumannii]|nr:hypothetical protein [Acinetobacter baumannii]
MFIVPQSRRGVFIPRCDYIDRIFDNDIPVNTESSSQCQPLDRIMLHQSRYIMSHSLSYEPNVSI